MMAALCDKKTRLCFQNTGREAERTYEFLGELSDGLGRSIEWLEFRPPKRRGGRPCESRVAIVTHGTADRSGAPFEMLMQALNDFRASKGKGPIAPWWRSRICTTYMKTRTARNRVHDLGWTKWDELVGLRLDEPNRVAKLRVGVPKYIGRFAPLSEAGIAKEDVDSFWDDQPFKLGLDPLLGNCVGCFLKDQADLSRALTHPDADPEWWIAMEARYKGWGGKNFAGYRRLLNEAPMRLRIESAIRNGDEPQNDGVCDDHRFRLVVLQERKRVARLVTPFACGCEGSDAAALLDSEEEEQWILSLESEDASG